MMIILKKIEKGICERGGKPIDQGLGTPRDFHGGVKHPKNIERQ